MRLLSNSLLKDFQVEFNIIRYDAYTVALVVNTGLKKFKPIIDKV